MYKHIEKSWNYASSLWKNCTRGNSEFSVKNNMKITHWNWNKFYVAELWNGSTFSSVSFMPSTLSYPMYANKDYSKYIFCNFLLWAGYQNLIFNSDFIMKVLYKRVKWWIVMIKLLISLIQNDEKCNNEHIIRSKCRVFKTLRHTINLKFLRAIRVVIKIML